jgi:hypothetical protein
MLDIRVSPPPALSPAESEVFGRLEPWIKKATTGVLRLTCAARWTRVPATLGSEAHFELFVEATKGNISLGQKPFRFLESIAEYDTVYRWFADEERRVNNLVESVDSTDEKPTRAI